jgi:putative FmdB family regulatory protein
MPTYAFECRNPETPHRFEIIQPISAELPKTCTECGAGVDQTYDDRPTQSVIFRGRGWTPNFHGPSR